MDRLPVTPSWRKPAGIGLILAIITLWAVIIASVAGRIGAMPRPVQAVFYLIAGIAWILPLKPLLRWIETGKWRE